MTKFEGIGGFSEASTSSRTGADFSVNIRDEAAHSFFEVKIGARANYREFFKNRSYFCLPSFAACGVSRTNICQSQASPAYSLQSYHLSCQSTGVASCSEEVTAVAVIKKKKNKKGRGKPVPTYGGINYGSVSEAALGILLEELIPGFSVKEGKTFQLPLGQGRTVDFLIENTLVEFHYPRSFSRGNDLGDFRDFRERRDFLRALGRVGRNRHQRKKLLRATHEQLMRNYTAKRRRQIDNSVYGPHTELIVASTPQEFYWKVICRFVGLEVISENSFVERFDECCRSVISVSKKVWKEAA